MMTNKTDNKIEISTSTDMSNEDSEPIKRGHCWLCPICRRSFLANKYAAEDCRDSHFQGIDEED